VTVRNARCLFERQRAFAFFAVFYLFRLASQLRLYYNKENEEVCDMAEPVLRIPRKKYGGETTVVSMRMAKELLKDLDHVAALSGRNRSEILTMSLEFALNHMEIVIKEQEEA
jgi:hypothetical protein